MKLKNIGIVLMAAVMTIGLANTVFAEEMEAATEAVPADDEMAG